MSNGRLTKQIDFLMEIDQLKRVIRNNYLTDGSRKENTAEHSWHLSIMVMLLAEYIDQINVLKTIRMVLVHDLVEVYAGDVYCYDEQANIGKFDREKKAAEILFAKLPPDQSDDFMKLWLEFEARETTESYFAVMLDRLQPLLLNYYSQGRSWLEHGISGAKVKERNKIFQNGPELLAKFVENIIDDAIAKGYLHK